MRAHQFAATRFHLALCGQHLIATFGHARTSCAHAGARLAQAGNALVKLGLLGLHSGNVLFHGSNLAVQLFPFGRAFGQRCQLHFHTWQRGLHLFNAVFNLVGTRLHLGNLRIEVVDFRACFANLGVHIGNAAFQTRQAGVHLFNARSHFVQAVLHFRSAAFHSGNAAVHAVRCLLNKLRLELVEHVGCHFLAHAHNGGYVGVLHFVDDSGANGHAHVAVFAGVAHVHGNVGVAHQLGNILVRKHGGGVFVRAHLVHLLVNDLRVRQGVHGHFFGQLVHEVRLHASACVHDERDHNGGRHGGADGAHQRKRCQCGVRFGVVRVLQHHVVQRRAHGKAQAQAGQNQHEAHVKQGGVIAGHKRHEQRTNGRTDKTKGHDRLHAVLVNKLARHHGAHAAANA